MKTTTEKDPVVPVPKEVHSRVKAVSEKTGLKIRAIVAKALDAWLRDKRNGV